MSRALGIYRAVLLVLITGWVFLQWPTLTVITQSARIIDFVVVMLLYLCSHVVRMLRLALLTLDDREKAFPLVGAHTLTAFPSSFLPFKMGEVIRLSAFLYVFEGRRKALAVWLTERFGDVLVIAIFILGLYLFNIRVPLEMRTVFVLFVLVSVLGLLSLFAVAKVFVYLNRHLVLVSHSAHGLALLRASHALRLLEQDIFKSVEGRLSGVLLLSILIWALEIFALALFINRFSVGEQDLAALFASGLLASLPSGELGDLNDFGFYQTLALVVLTFVFLVAGRLAACFSLWRS